jgi:Protein of unknown function (DUF541)
MTTPNINPDHIVATIDGLAVLEVPNDLAHFTLAIKAKQDDLNQAKSQIKDKTAKVMKLLNDWQARGMQLEGEIITTPLSYKLEHREGRDRMPAGFQATNTFQFTIRVSDDLDEIYRSCLDIDPHMSRPKFSINNKDEALDKAITLASENAGSKLARECALLGVDPKALKIRDWHFGYEGILPSATNFSSKGGYYGATGPQGSMSYAGVSGGVFLNAGQVSQLGSIYQELLDTVKIEAGSDTFRVAVRVNYVWKTA